MVKKCQTLADFQQELSSGKLKNDREIVKQPICPYKIQPENQEQLVWLAGYPGTGKSTTALMMAKRAGYVYYEGDAISKGVNPLIPPDTEVDNLHANIGKQAPLKVRSFSP